MKYIISNILLVIGLFFLPTRIRSQVPTYSLCVRNITYVSINNPNDAIVFDIYMLHTNSSTVFQFAGGQFFLSFNRNIFNPPPPYPPGNDSIYISYKVIGSELPLDMVPRNPLFGSAANPSADILRFAINTFKLKGGIIDTVYPGTMIAKMRIWNKTGSMNNAPLNLQWRNPPIVSNATKVFAIVNNYILDITTPSTHCIESVTNVKTETENPGKFILYQNYPNPFNPKTIISYELKAKSYVKLTIFDVTGKEIATLADEFRNVGYYEVIWDGGDNASGVYIYELIAGYKKEVKRMVLSR